MYILLAHGPGSCSVRCRIMHVYSVLVDSTWNVLYLYLADVGAISCVRVRLTCVLICAMQWSTLAVRKAVAAAVRSRVSSDLEDGMPCGLDVFWTISWATCTSQLVVHNVLITPNYMHVMGSSSVLVSVVCNVVLSSMQCNLTYSNPI
jgi:hypothetical protein